MASVRHPAQPAYTMRVATSIHIRACMVALAALVTGACANTVLPPPAPAQPTSAFLLDHGRHSSVVVQGDDGLTRYSYGQWDWYVENRTGPFRASGTLFASSTAGLGRKRLRGPAELATVRRQVRVPIEAAWRFEVPARRARELDEHIDRIFADQAESHTRNRLYDLEFVHHPVAYGAGNNSNHMTAEWLRTLGCEVEMGGPFSIWRVEEREDGSDRR